MATGRFAPSPTGELHVGNLRTALVAWLLARSSGGRFLVRMEDLDPVTSSRDKARVQLEDLAALGITFDGELVFQSERFALYDDAIARLETAGLTYPCFCSRREVAEAASAPHGSPGARYPGTCRALSADEQENRRIDGRRSALRLRADAAVVEFTDRMIGHVRAAADDIVLRRNDGTPAYNLAVVVDDELQGVEEVVRGDDLIPSTPAQIVLAGLFGFRRPSYAHIPLVLGPGGQRLAKRDGAVSLGQLCRAGATADQVLSLIAASLNLASPRETVATATLLDRFDPERLPREPWVFSPSLLPG